MSEKITLEEASESIPRRAGWVRRLAQRRLVWVALIGLSLFGLAAVFAEEVSPYTQVQQDVEHALEGPSHQHWMGTDELGRDLFARVLHGARVSLAVALITSLFSLFFGAAFGAFSGYRGGRIDHLLMRIVDVFYSFPDLLIIILLTMVLKGEGDTGMVAIIIALTLTSWASVARVVRGEVLRLRELAYVESARALGAGHGRVLWRHILPNTTGALVVLFTYRIPTIILAESTVSFLGQGLRPPYASWGTLVHEGWVAMQYHAHLILFPCLAISLTVLAFNILGDALRDAIDPDRRAFQGAVKPSR